MLEMNRRLFMGGLAAAAAGVAAGCTGPGSGGSQPGPSSSAGAVTLEWWDHFQALGGVFQERFDLFQNAHPGVTVSRTQTNTNDQGRVLTLARQGSGLPDVFTPVGLEYPIARLVADGWMTPLPLQESDLDALPPNSLFEGVTRFDGEIYSFPMFSPRQYNTTCWINTEVLAATDHSPEDLDTWDGFRAVARAVKDRGDAAGIVLPISEVGWLSAFVGELATTLGGWYSGNSATEGGIDPRTGEYELDSDAFVQAIEFLQALRSDGLVLPGSESLDVLNSRARWATGASAFYWDGPWNAGIVEQNFPEFTEKIGVAKIPTADAGSRAVYRRPASGVFWASSDASDIELVGELLKLFATEDYYVQLANAMDQPPINADVVATSDATDAYKLAVANYAEDVRIAPSAVVRNTAVTDVFATMEQATPDLGTIVQGVLTDQIDDIRGALTEYSDKLSASRAAALSEVAASGSEVTADDWIFSNWIPGEDFTPDMY